MHPGHGHSKLAETEPSSAAEAVASAGLAPALPDSVDAAALPTRIPTGYVLAGPAAEQVDGYPLLVAEIGASYTRCAWSPAPGHLLGVQHYDNDRFDCPLEMLALYLGGIAAQPSQARIAVAATVRGPHVALSNRDWVLSVDETCAWLGLGKLMLVNDLVAAACALPLLECSPWLPGHEVCPQPARVQVILGVGTGLGMAVRLPDADGGATVMASEFGHTDLPAGNRWEAGLVEQLRGRRGGHCSREAAVSGAGLAEIYTYFGDEAPPLAPAAILARAEAGDLRAIEAVQRLLDLYAGACGDAVLTSAAYGGVFLTGGMTGRCRPWLVPERFHARFCDKGRYAELLAQVPIVFVEESVPALLGLAALSLR